MDEAERLFSGGSPNPNRFGVWVHGSAGEASDLERLHEAAKLLDRELRYTDDEGYECEIFSAAVGPNMQIAYVESRAKDVGRYIDISIRVHLAKPEGSEESIDIESYNPYFGCDVGLFEWAGDIAVLIYREKHRTYACRFGNAWPPMFVEIEHRWVVRDNQLGYLGYQDLAVSRLSSSERESTYAFPFWMSVAAARSFAGKGGGSGAVAAALNAWRLVSHSFPIPFVQPETPPGFPHLKSTFADQVRYNLNCVKACPCVT